jgi:lipopolysaccharide transport system permease protein
MNSTTASVTETATLETHTKQPSSLSKPLPERPVVVNEPTHVLSIFHFRDLWDYRELLYFLTLRDIKVRYKQTAMGAAWAVIQPLALMIIFTIFFGIFMRVPTDGMPTVLFYYAGLLPWTFFANAISATSVSLLNNNHLITKVYFPRVLIPAATIGAGLIDLAIASILLLGLTVYFGVSFTWNILMLPLILLLTILLSFGLGIWLSALTVKYRDVRHALPFTLQVWMFLSPIIYPLSIVNEEWQPFMAINPMVGIIEAFRSSITGEPFNWVSLSISLFIALTLLIFSIFAFRRLEQDFADLI